MSLVFNPSDETLLSQARELVQNLKTMGRDQAEINLSDAKWITPLSILPISCLGSTYQSSKVNLPSGDKVGNYLSTICFPDGTQSLPPGWTKTYLPIMTIKSNMPEKQIYEAISQYQRHILTFLVEDQTFRDRITNAIGYVINEFFTNYQEHSKAEEFRIISQLYPNKDYLEICLLDNGIGIKNSYLRAPPSLTVTNDADAIKKAVSGFSTKPGERGYGMRTSIKLICESALKGEIVIVSGSACYHGAHGQNYKIYSLSSSWDGVICAIKIHKPMEQIDIYKYIE